MSTSININSIPPKRVPSSHKKSQSTLTRPIINLPSDDIRPSKSPTETANLSKPKLAILLPTAKGPQTHRPSKNLSSLPRMSQVVSPKVVEKINIAPYMIIFPQDEVIETAPRAQTVRNNFISFNALVEKGPLKVVDNQTRELFTPFTTTNALRKQLNFNKQQEDLFRRTADSFRSKSQSMLEVLKKENEIKNKKMPKVKVHPSLRFPEPQKLIFEEEVSNKEVEDEEKARIKYPKYIKFIKFGPNDKYNFHWCNISDSGHLSWKPTGRESASFVVIGKCGYLYGGRSKDLNNDLAVLDITKWEWSQPVMTKEIPPHGRFGHTANAYQKTLIIFGGVKSFNATLNIRECLNDVRFYQTDTGEWSYIKCTGDFVDPRRHHTAVVVGRHLVVHGGINSRGEYLDDLKCLDLITARWTTCPEAEKENLGVAFHKSCLVLYDQRRDVNLFKMFDFRPDEKFPIIKEEGIYFFGGRHGDDSVNNTLKILKIGQSTLTWTVPETLGKPPEARYLHTMVHCKSLNMLVIYGGRNDHLFAKGGTPVLGDFYTLQLETLTWVGVNTLGEAGSARFSHVSVTLGTSLIIFGGINFNSYCPCDINLIEMDQMVVNKLVRSHGKKRGSQAFEVQVNTKSPIEKFHPEVRMETDGQKTKYAGITSFLPLPNQFKREKNKSPDIPNSLRDYFASIKNAVANDKIELD